MINKIALICWQHNSYGRIELNNFTFKGKQWKKILGISTSFPLVSGFVFFLLLYFFISWCKKKKGKRPLHSLCEVKIFFHMITRVIITNYDAYILNECCNLVYWYFFVQRARTSNAWLIIVGGRVPHFIFSLCCCLHSWVVWSLLMSLLFFFTLIRAWPPCLTQWRCIFVVSGSLPRPLFPLQHTCVYCLLCQNNNKKTKQKHTNAHAKSKSLHTLIRLKKIRFENLMCTSLPFFAHKKNASTEKILLFMAIMWHIVVSAGNKYLNIKLEMQWCVNKKVQNQLKRVQMEKPKN